MYNPTSQVVRKAEHAGWQKISNVMVPPELASSIMQCLETEVQRILETEGMAAFEMPRSAAIAHETGHAVVGTAVGLTIVHVEIHKRCGQWCGKCDEATPWATSPDTPMPVILNRIRYLVAGAVAEMLFDEYRHGSSLNEIVLAQTWCAGLFQERPKDFVGIEHPKEIWNACFRETEAILRRNADVVRKMMAKLDRCECLKGKPLAASLRRVK